VRQAPRYRGLVGEAGLASTAEKIRRQKTICVRPQI